MIKKIIKNKIFKTFLTLLSFFAVTNISFAAIPDTFTATETQAYTAEVKASATLEFTGGATDGSHIIIGDCRIDFDSNAAADDDNDCSDNTAVTASFATPAELNTFFDSLTNVTDNVVWGTYVPHGALSVVDVDGTHTQFITTGAEIGDGNLYIGGANGNLSMSNQIAGVIKKPQILTFTPANPSSEGGVRFGAHVGNAWHFYTTSTANHTIKDIVEALQSDLNNEAGFTCTEDDTKIECTATDDQNHGFGAEVSDISKPLITSNGGPGTVNVNVDENSAALTTVIATDNDNNLLYTLVGGDDEDLFKINSISGVLEFKNAPDFENKIDHDGNGVYDVQIYAKDEANNRDAQMLHITVDNVNEAPTDISIDSDNINENLGNHTVGLLTVVDPDGNGSQEFYQGGRGLNACAIPGADDDKFSINGNNKLRIVNPANYEVKSTYHVCIRGVDDEGLFFDKNLTIHINDVNETPILTSGYSVSVEENQTTVTTITASDEDVPAQTLTYSLSNIATLFSPDFDQFTINSNTGELSFITAPDFENPIDRAGANTAAHDNNYYVIVDIADGIDISHNEIKITVTDVVNEYYGHGKSRKKEKNHKTEKNTEKKQEESDIKKEDSLKELKENLIQQIEELKRRIEILIQKKQQSSKKQICNSFVGNFNFKLGDKSQEVSKIQTFLKEKGYFKFPYITDYYGSVTEKAVRDFQTAHSAENLNSTGVWDGKTRTVAFKIYNDSDADEDCLQIKGI